MSVRYGAPRSTGATPGTPPSARGRAAVDARLHGAAPAPYRALDLIAAARTADRDTAFAAEDEALADLIMSPELRSGLYAFDLVQKRARRPAGAPDKSLARPVGQGGHRRRRPDGQPARPALRPPARGAGRHDRPRPGAGGRRAWPSVHGEVDKLLAKGRVEHRQGQPAARPWSPGSTDLADFADADFVLEAVFEELSVKKQVFADLEAIVGADTVLATNTSSLSVTEMAGGPRTPRAGGGVPLLQPGRDPAAARDRAWRARRTTRRWRPPSRSAETLKKSSVLVKDAPAFVVNRLLTRFLGEITKAVDEGTDPEVADHALDPLGLPMSPFVLLQLVGPAIGLHVAETLHEAFGDRFYVSDNLRALVAAKQARAVVLEREGPALPRRRHRRAPHQRRLTRRPRSRCASGPWSRWPRRSA